MRISYVDVIPDDDYLPLRKSEPDSTFFKYKGKIKKMFGVVRSPGVAIASEFINGHWKPIVETPVDADTCCLFGEQYLSIGPRDGIGHLLDLHSTQVPQKLRPSFLSPRLLKKLKKDGFGEPILLKLKNNKLLITYSGVTPNEITYGFGKRFYLCDIPCVKPQKIADNSDYFVETAFADNHFFILTAHGEYQVFSLNDGKLIMTIKPVNYSQDHGGWTP